MNTTDRQTDRQTDRLQNSDIDINKQNRFQQCRLTIGVGVESNAPPDTI